MTDTTGNPKMADLTLAGVSEDGTRLLLVDDRGEQFTLAVDHRLRSALRGEHARLGQLEITMDSTLRPRDIQNRIRAGETPEAVAEAAQTTVDRILPYAGPVLAERAHVAERAQRSSVRRPSGSEGARTLGEAVAARLGDAGHTREAVDWDAWRREDGRWTLAATFTTDDRTGRATFVYDAPGNYVTLEDDDARWLVGEGSTREEGRDDLKRARRRRLAAVPEDELPLGDDAMELANESSDADLSPTPEPLADEPAGHGESDEDAPPPDDAAPGEADATVAGDDAEESEEPAAGKPVPRRPAKKRGRASVPSWDEIMFGGGDRG